MQTILKTSSIEGQGRLNDRFETDERRFDYYCRKMKIRCDIKIQNLNHQTTSNQEKLHKSCMIGLYRPRCDDPDSSNHDPSGIIITIEAKNLSLKYKLKRVEIHSKFINDGKATLKLVDENIYLLLSNCPALTLINFVSFLNLKMRKSTEDKENRSAKSFASRLLDRAECKLGPSQLKNISPLCDTDLNVIAQRKAVQKSMESPLSSRTLSKPKVCDR